MEDLLQNMISITLGTLFILFDLIPWKGIALFILPIPCLFLISWIISAFIYRKEPIIDENNGFKDDKVHEGTGIIFCVISCMLIGMATFKVLLS